PQARPRPPEPRRLPVPPLRALKRRTPAPDGSTGRRHRLVRHRPGTRERRPGNLPRAPFSSRVTPSASGLDLAAPVVRVLDDARVHEVARHVVGELLTLHPPLSAQRRLTFGAELSPDRDAHT